MDFEEIEAGLVRSAGGAREVARRRSPCRRASSRAALDCGREMRDRRQRRSAASRRPASGSLSPSHSRCVAPLRPACPSWTPIAAGVSRCTKSTTRFHAADVFRPCRGRRTTARSAPRARRRSSPPSPVPRRPSRGCRDAPRCQSPTVPSSAAVLAHRRDDDAVRQHEVAQPEQREHRRRRLRGGRGPGTRARPVDARSCRDLPFRFTRRRTRRRARETSDRARADPRA